MPCPSTPLTRQISIWPNSLDHTARYVFSIGQHQQSIWVSLLPLSTLFLLLFSFSLPSLALPPSSNADACGPAHMQYGMLSSLLKCPQGSHPLRHLVLGRERRPCLRICRIQSASGSARTTFRGIQGYVPGRTGRRRTLEARYTRV